MKYYVQFLTYLSVIYVIQETDPGSATNDPSKVVGCNKVLFLCTFSTVHKYILIHLYFPNVDSFSATFFVLFHCIFLTKPYVTFL